MTARQKRILKRRLRTFKEKAGTGLAGIGFMGFMIFAAAIDGPGNDMALVYGGILANMALLTIGGTMTGEIEE